MLRLFTYILLLVFCVFSTGLMAEFYKWTDANGQVHFSDKLPVSHQAESVELNEITTYTSVTVSNVDTKSESTSNSALPDKETVDKKTVKKNRKVVIYSAAWCSICTRAKNYFKSKKIAYKEYDIETSKKGRRDFIRLNARGVPVILVGKKRMDGFDVNKFEAMY
ncbi:MAG TPA: DUF4124 domain-containing protein [Gammaproteobacteria bacterium]|nr:DUF4124 domain-containing protein [Gammaproteobacteria bacterium]